MERSGVHRQVVVEVPEQYGIALTRLDLEVIRATAGQVTGRAQGTCGTVCMHTTRCEGCVVVTFGGHQHSLPPLLSLQVLQLAE